jgi:signal transduction histidine kinase
MLDDLGFNATIEWLCNEFSLLNDIPCSFENGCDEENLTPEIRTDLFRICQESLTNVTYHAQASSVHVLIEDLSDKIQLTITDDGKGFDINQEKETPGLINMYERAASINGQLTVESTIGEGTRVSFIVDKQVLV